MMVNDDCINMGLFINGGIHLSQVIASIIGKLGIFSVYTIFGQTHIMVNNDY